MAEDVEIVIKGRDESKPAFEQAKFSEDQLKISTKSLGDEFTQTGVKQSVSKQILKDLIGGYQNADSIIMGFSNHIEQSGNFSEYLDVQLGKLRNDAKLLGEEFNRTGSVDIFGKLRENQNATSSLERLKKDLTKALDDGSSQGGQGLAKSIEGGAAQGSAGMWEILGYGAAAAAPLIAGTISAAVLAGVALGGIATGIVGQLHDPQIDAAASSAGKGIMAALTADTIPFKQPILDAINEISGAITSTLGAIDFKTLADEVKPLAEGIAGLIQQLGPGLNAAISGSEPVMQALGQVLPEIGKALSVMLSEIASGGPQAAEALRAVVLVLGGLLIAVGGVIEILTKLFGAIISTVSAVQQFSSSLTSWIPGVSAVSDVVKGFLGYLQGAPNQIQTFGRSLTDAGNAAAGSAPDYAALNQQLAQVTQNADTTAGAMSDKLFSALMNSDQATLKFDESLTNLSDTLKQNKNQLDIHSKAGQQDREAILRAVQANIKMYDTMIQTGSSAQDAAHAYDQNTQALVKQMRQAGLTQSQIDGLIGKYKNVPDTVNTNITLLGLTDAINNLNETLRLINGLHDKTVTISMRYNVYGAANARGAMPGFQAHGGIVGAASGRTIGDGLTWVGEQGPELMSLPAGVTVHSNPDSMRMASQGSGGGGYGGEPPKFELVVSSDSNTGVAQLIRELIYSGKLSLGIVNNKVAIA